MTRSLPPHLHRYASPLTWTRVDYSDAPDSLIVEVVLVGAEQVSTVEVDPSNWVVVRTVGPELDQTSADELGADVHRSVEGGRVMCTPACPCPCPVQPIACDDCAARDKADREEDVETDQDIDFVRAMGGR